MQTLEVMRDGQLDPDYLKAQQRAERIETLQNAGLMAITAVERAVKLTGKGLGEFVVACYHDSDLYRTIQHSS